MENKERLLTSAENRNILLSPTENTNRNRLLTTAEASAATGLSQRELRDGAKQGRYPVIIPGDPEKGWHKLKWNIDKLWDAIDGQMVQGVHMEDV